MWGRQPIATAQKELGWRREISFEQLVEGMVIIDGMEQSVMPADVFYISPGKVHAIGAGALIAEIQESSNLTYRMYDYNRLDKDGRPRPLHIDKAVEVADLKGGTEPRLLTVKC